MKKRLLFLMGLLCLNIGVEAQGFNAIIQVFDNGWGYRDAWEDETVCNWNCSFALEGNHYNDTNYINHWYFVSITGDSIPISNSDFCYHPQMDYGYPNKYVYEVTKKSTAEVKRDTVNLMLLEPIGFTDGTITLKDTSPSFYFDQYLYNNNGWGSAWIVDQSTGMGYGEYDVFDPSVFGVGVHSFVLESSNCGNGDTLHVIVEPSDISNCLTNLQLFPNFSRFRNGTVEYPGLKVKNLSDETKYNIEGYFVIDDVISINSFSGDGALSISGDTVHYEIDSLESQNTAKFRLEAQVPNNINNLGMVLCFKYTAWESCSKDSLKNNPKQICSFISAPYDPNHKEATVGDGGITPDTDELTYVIQFQNMGNDTAYKVVVEDTINPAYFVIDSIKTLSSSDPYEMTIDKDNNLVRWEFSGINLVDSTTNEPESHGSFRFVVPLKPGISASAMIENKAHIYFDFNPAIVTNTALNYFEIPSGEEEIIFSQLNISTTPEKILVLNCTLDKSEVETIRVFSITGQEVFNQSTVFLKGDNKINVSLQNLKSGVYVVAVGDVSEKIVLR